MIASDSCFKLMIRCATSCLSTEASFAPLRSLGDSRSEAHGAFQPEMLVSSARPDNETEAGPRCLRWLTVGLDIALSHERRMKPDHLQGE